VGESREDEGVAGVGGSGSERALRSWTLICVDELEIE
jgi:hypothetical protein